MSIIDLILPKTAVPRKRPQWRTFAVVDLCYGGRSLWRAVLGLRALDQNTILLTLYIYKAYLIEVHFRSSK